MIIIFYFFSRIKHKEEDVDMVIENSEEGRKKKPPPLSLQVDSPISKANNDQIIPIKRESDNLPLNLVLNQEIEMSKILSPPKNPGHLRKSSFSPKKKGESTHKSNGSQHNSPEKFYPQEENNAGSQILLNSKKKSLKKKFLNYLSFKKMNKSR